MIYNSGQYTFYKISIHLIYSYFNAIFLDKEKQRADRDIWVGPQGSISGTR